MAKDYVFPSSLRSQNYHPRICFRVESTRDSVNLPIPPGITFSDGMNFTSMDLGIVGGAVADLLSDKNFQGDIMTTANAMAESVGKRFSDMNLKAAAIIAGKTLPTNVASGLSLGLKKITAPNTNALFQGSTIRQFSFKFKLIAADSKESQNIRGIVDTFRKYMYPEGNTVLVGYPDTWEITFAYATLPEIKQCYLTSLNTSYNNSTNAFFEDNSPFEVDIDLTFQETRALTREDLYGGRKGSRAEVTIGESVPQPTPAPPRPFGPLLGPDL